MQHFTAMTINTKNKFFAQLKASFFFFYSCLGVFIYLLGRSLCKSFNEKAVPLKMGN